jgi:phosphate-selective porin
MLSMLSQFTQDEAARLARYHKWKAMTLTLPAATSAAAAAATTSATAGADSIISTAATVPTATTGAAL